MHRRIVKLKSDVIRGDTELYMKLHETCKFLWIFYRRSYQVFLILLWIDSKFYEKSSYDNLNEPFSAVLEIFEISLKNLCDGGFEILYWCWRRAAAVTWNAEISISQFSWPPIWMGVAVSVERSAYAGVKRT